MAITSLVMVATLLSGQRDDTVKQAIAVVEKAEGKIVIDRNAPGQPVVGVDL